MGQEVALRRCGYLFLLDSDDDLRHFRDNVELQNRHGVPSQVLGTDAIRSLVPEVDLTGVIGGTWCPRDGLVDPHGLLQGYISCARKLGARLETRAPATAIDVAAGRVRGVTTPDGVIDTPAVVIAAGPWSGRVASLADVELPIQPIRRQIAVTNPIPRLRADFPFVIDFSRALYFHREGPGILTGMSNRDEPPGFDTSVDEEWRLTHIENAVARLPMLAETELLAEWAGLYEVTPDDQPILGRLPHADGLFVCAGFSGHGLMHGPAAGLLMAEEILDGRARTIDIDPVRWDRFGKGTVAAEYNVV
jgi:sarcosine oxidase subunit beta